jgi:hypothetical protein
MLEPSDGDSKAYFAILQTLYSFARAVDRCDRNLLTLCFWPEAVIDEGTFKPAASEYVDWVLGLIRQEYELTQHLILNVRPDFLGTEVHTESYFYSYERMRSTEEPRDCISCGRYLDIFSRQGTEWRIAHRRVVVDWSMSSVSSDKRASEVLLIGDLVTVARGKQGSDDLSYTKAVTHP